MHEKEMRILQGHLVWLSWHGRLDVGSRHGVEWLRQLSDAVSHTLAGQPLHCIQGNIVLIAGRRPATNKLPLLMQCKLEDNKTTLHMQAHAKCSSAASR